MGPSWRISEDGTKVIVDFPSTPPCSLSLDATEVDAMLRNLGEYRGGMKPPVDDKLDPKKSVSALGNPKWGVGPAMGTALLHIHDQRFGWLHYLLPLNEAKNLGEALVKLAADGGSPPQGRA